VALRLPGHVEELLWIDFCGHERFASWVSDDTETAKEPDSQRQWAQQHTGSERPHHVKVCVDDDNSRPDGGRTVDRPGAKRHGPPPS
jgi:hypothetical protein